MGNPRPKRCLPAHVNRVKPVASVCPLRVYGTQVDVAGFKPRLLVTVRMLNRADKKGLRNTLHALGLELLVPTNIDPAVTGYPFSVAVPGTVATETDGNGATIGTCVLDVMGTVEGLQSLIANAFVTKWELVMNASVVVVASGTGADKVRSSGKGSKPRWFGSDTDGQHPKRELTIPITATVVDAMPAKECPIVIPEPTAIVQ